jgi:predicted dehydrogenase
VQIERLLVVGYGSIGQRHLRIARSLLPDADIRVMRHRPCETTPELANGCMSSIAAAIVFAPQAAVIANPATLHVQVARPLAERGVHLLIEKPLADTPHAVADLPAVCRAQGVVLMTAYNLRFAPSLQRFRDEVQNGRIGKVISVRCEIGQYLPSWRPGSDYREGVSASRALGGGALLELSHEIDYLRWIFGDVAVVNAVLSQQSDLQVDVEDTAHLVLGFAPDTNGRRLRANLSMDFVRQDTTRTCVAIGESGSLRWNALSGTVGYLPGGATVWENVFVHAPQRDETYLAEWHHFLACVNAGTQPVISGEDGLAALNIIEAARASAEMQGAAAMVGGRQ